MALSTPVAFIIFNRPDLTQLVFNEIRKAKPHKLFVIADGPRHHDEWQKCEAARKVIEQIDWECTLFQNYAPENLGCQKRVASGITWVFENVEKAIILEDDCLPSPSFFVFCESLLNKYSDDMRIMQISGYNAQQQWDHNKEDYFFSHFGEIWGWATWRRAWEKYDLNMTHLNYILQYKMLRHLLGKKLGMLRESQFINCRDQKIDTWDFQWAYTRHLHSGLSIVPRVSLIQNLGFREDATHTKSQIGNHVSASDINFPLKTNNVCMPFCMPDSQYDSLFFNSSRSKAEKIIIKLNNIFQTLLGTR